MPVTQFSEKQWNTIVAPALEPSLQKAGMAKNFPRDVFYVPDLYQGFQVMHPYFNQEICHIVTLLQESVSSSQTGKLLRGTAEAFRLEIGVPFTMGTVDFKIGSKYKTDCWYKHMWKFVDAHPIEIIEDFPDVPLLRKGDLYLMTAFITAGYRDIQLKRLNTMRMAMKVVTVADIATPDGRRITQCALTLKSGNHLRDHYDWPRAPPGTFCDAYAELWKEALNKALILQQGGPNNRTLYYRNWLGSWTDTKVLERWEWFFSPAEDRIYQRVDGEWRAW